MKIFAAIDLKNGNCVRLVQGDPEAETVYGEDPAAIAGQWQATATDWLHVVNLDGALDDPGKSAKNVAALRAILARVTVPVQFGGGLRTLDDIKRTLDLGVSRVIIGSMAAEQPQMMIGALKQFGAERIVLGLDVRNGNVATHGWQQEAGTDPVKLAKSFQAAGLGHVIYTDISRDGMLSGVDLAGTVALAQAGQSRVADQRFEVIASGGVAGIEDIKRLKAVEAEGIEGVIIGKALYTGKVDLAEALAVAHGVTY